MPGMRRFRSPQRDRRIKRELSERVERLRPWAITVGKPIIAHGGVSFARSLVAHGLVDQWVLGVHPIALGKGLPLFSELNAPCWLLRKRFRAARWRRYIGQPERAGELKKTAEPLRTPPFLLEHHSMRVRYDPNGNCIEASFR